MAKYLLKRLAFGLFSAVAVVAIVMVMIYSLMDRNLIFAQDPTYSHMSNNAKVTYKYQKWEEYGYLDYITYADYINGLVASGEMTEEEKSSVITIGKTEAGDSEAAKVYIEKFKEYYKAQGYENMRLEAVMLGKKYADGGQPQLFVYKDVPLGKRLLNYFGGLIRIDNINFAKGEVGERGISFTLYDPVYGGEKFSPAIIGNGSTNICCT